MYWGVLRNIDRSQTGEAGARGQPARKPRGGFIVNALSIFVEDDLSYGQSSRADEAHFSAQDVDDLGQFVQTSRAQHVADARDALIILFRLFQSEFQIGVRNHGAEFENHEPLSESSPPLLAVKDRATVIELDGEGDEAGYGGRQEEHD